MGRDRWHYKLECLKCGETDQLTMWDDDWNRWGIEGMQKFSGRVYVTGPRPEVLACVGCGERGPKIEHTP